MTCERWEPLLSLYWDGELSASDVSQLDRHLKTCERCREELASFRELSDVLATQPVPDPFFLTRFRARRDEELGTGAVQVWRRLAVRLLPLAAAALIVAATVIWLSVDDAGLVELEARHLGDGFVMATEGGPYSGLQIALEPFPGGEQ